MTRYVSHRRGEGQLPDLAVVPSAEGLPIELLHLESEAAIEEIGGGLSPHRRDPGDSRAQPPHLWLPTGARRTALFRPRVRPNEGGTTDEGGRPPRLHAWTPQEEVGHPPGLSFAARPRTRGSPLSRRSPRPPLVGRHNVCPDPGRFPLPLLHSRRVQLRSGRLADGRSPQNRVGRRRPADGSLKKAFLLGVIHHSNQGSQYTSLSFGKRLEEAGVLPSMGKAGSALNNAMAESFVSTLKAEMVLGHQFLTREAARMAIFDYIESFYNPIRRHSSIGQQSAVDLIGFAKCNLQGHLNEKML